MDVWRRWGPSCGLADRDFAHQLTEKLNVPSTLQLKKIRRLATKTRASTACTQCKRDKRRCSDCRPCPRCVASGQREECSMSTDLEFPIAFSVNLMDFRNDGNGKFPNLMLKHHWSFQFTRAYWTVGYQVSSLIRIFESIPPQMSAAVDNLFTAMQRLKQVKARSPTIVSRILGQSLSFLILIDGSHQASSNTTCFDSSQHCLPKDFDPEEVTSSLSQTTVNIQCLRSSHTE